MTREQDQQLQRFLDRDDELGEIYDRLPKGEPPAAMDDAILKAARAEAQRPMRPRWFIPLSVAATVVIGVGLSYQQLSTPFEPVADVSIESINVDGQAIEAQTETVRVSANRTRERSPGTQDAGAPASRPSLEQLTRPSAIEDSAMRKAQIDAPALREQALSEDRLFVPPPADAPATPDRTRRRGASR